MGVLSCVCVCVCVRERERQRERDLQTSTIGGLCPSCVVTPHKEKTNCCAIPSGHGTWSRRLKKEHPESVRIQSADENMSSYDRRSKETMNINAH